MKDAMKHVHGSGDDGQKPTSARLTASGLGLILALVLILFALMSFLPEVTVQEFKTARPRTTVARTRVVQSKAVAPTTSLQKDLKNSAPVASIFKLIPKPMRLTRKVLVSKKWNSADDAFGRNEPPPGEEGGAFGPSSIACAKDAIYVLDTVHNRVLGYDKDGHAISLANLPTSGLVSDLVVDPSDSSLLVVDHFHDNIYKVKGNEATLLKSVPMKEDITYGSRFSYDASSATLLAYDFDKGGDVAVLQNGQTVDVAQRKVQALSFVTSDSEGNNLILNLKSRPNLTISFDKPVQGVEEVVTDGRGMIWVLYTLEGDYRMRRLARVDPVRRTTEVAEVDVWFPYDGTRRMTATANGVALIGGDYQEGRLLSFDYVGGSL